MNATEIEGRAQLMASAVKRVKKYSALFLENFNAMPELGDNPGPAKAIEAFVHANEIAHTLRRLRRAMSDFEQALCEEADK